MSSNQINFFVNDNKLPKGNSNMLTLKKIQNFSYIISDQIGLGLTSKVYKGKNDQTNQIVAVKVIDLKKNQETQFLNDQVNALERIKKADTQHLLKLEGVFKTKNNLYIITEFCEGKDIGKILRKKRTVSQPEAQTIMKQILKGYYELYKLQIVHRDLKLHNIFVKNGKAKIADFGFALGIESCKQKSEYNVGSPTYMAPQALKDNIYSYKSDVWAMGVMAFQLVYGRAPWKDRNDAILYQMIHNSPLQQQFGFSPISQNYKNFIRKCLTIDINQRANPQFMINYQWPLAMQFVQGMDKLQPTKHASLMKIPNSGTTIRQIKSNNNIDAVKDLQKKTLSPGKQLPFFGNGIQFNNTTGNQEKNSSASYQNSSSGIGLKNTVNEGTSSPFRQINNPYPQRSSTPKNDQIYNGSNSGVRGNRISYPKPRSSIFEFNSYPLNNQDQINQKFDQNTAPQKMQKYFSSNTTSPNQCQSQLLLNQKKLNVSNVQQDKFNINYPNLNQYTNNAFESLAVNMERVNTVSYRQSLNLNNTNYLAQPCLLAQLHYCRFLSILYDKILESQSNISNFYDLKQEVGQRLLLKIGKMAQSSKTGQNVFSIPGFYEYIQKQPWGRLKQVIIKYQNEYQKKLQRTGVTKNEYYNHQNGIVEKVINELKFSLPQNLRLVELLTNFYQIQDLQKRLSPENFAQQSKIEFLASKKVYNNLSSQRLLNRIKCLGL